MSAVFPVSNPVAYTNSIDSPDLSGLINLGTTNAKLVRNPRKRTRFEFAGASNSTNASGWYKSTYDGSLLSASQSGTAITGVGTTFTSQMSPGLIVYDDGTSVLVTSYSSATQLTAATSISVSAQSFKIYYSGCFIDPSPAGGAILSVPQLVSASSSTTGNFAVGGNLIVGPGGAGNIATGSVSYTFNAGANWTNLQASASATTTQTMSLPSVTANDTLVSKTSTDVLTNKTINAANLTGTTTTAAISASQTIQSPYLVSTTGPTFGIGWADGGNTVSVVTPSLSGNSTLTLPTSTDTLVGRATADVLSNKTLASPAFTGTATGATFASPTFTGTALGATAGWTGSDTAFSFVSSDGINGGILLIDAGNSNNVKIKIPSLVATTTLTLPTVTDTLVARTTTDVLTNKTLTAPVISTITNTGTITLPTSTDTLVARATTDILTNKTLTAPVISTITNTGTLTLPTSTDTLVARATTDVLTNKTLSGNTLNTFVSNGVTFTNPTVDATVSGSKLISNASGTLSFSATGLIASGTIASGAVQTLSTAPVLLASAPGSGKTLIIESITIELVNGSTKFNNLGNPYVQYGSTHSLVNTATGVITQGSFLTSSSSASTNYLWSACGQIGGDTTGAAFFPTNQPVSTNIVNQGLYISVNGTNATQGNGSINWVVKYSIASTFT